MGKWIRSFVVLAGVACLSASMGISLSLAAGGSPPNGPIDPIQTGSDLKFACSQEIKGSEDVVGEQFYRWMLMVQCRAVVGSIVTMIQAGQFALDDSPRWQCVTDSRRPRPTVGDVRDLGGPPAPADAATCCNRLRGGHRAQRAVPEFLNPARPGPRIDRAIGRPIMVAIGTAGHS